MPTRTYTNPFNAEYVPETIVYLVINDLDRVESVYKTKKPAMSRAKRFAGYAWAKAIVDKNSNYLVDCEGGMR